MWVRMCTHQTWNMRNTHWAARYGKKSGLLEEILRVIHFRTVLLERQAIGLSRLLVFLTRCLQHCGYRKHLTCTPTIRCRNERCVNVKKSTILKELVCRKGTRVTIPVTAAIKLDLGRRCMYFLKFSTVWCFFESGYFAPFSIPPWTITFVAWSSISCSLAGDFTTLPWKVTHAPVPPHSFNASCPSTTFSVHNNLQRTVATSVVDVNKHLQIAFNPSSDDHVLSDRRYACRVLLNERKREWRARQRTCARSSLTRTRLRPKEVSPAECHLKSLAFGHLGTFTIFFCGRLVVLVPLVLRKITNTHTHTHHSQQRGFMMFVISKQVAKNLWRL